MSSVDQLTLIFAFYGAVLSTILGVREWRKERRKLSVILEHAVWQHRMHLVLINIGLRPITITEVKLLLGEGKAIEAVPGLISGYLGDGDTQSLPTTISDGEHVTLLLSEFASEAIIANSPFKLFVYDAEGKEYKKFKTRKLDSKYGGYFDPHK